MRVEGRHLNGTVSYAGIKAGDAFQGRWNYWADAVPALKVIAGLNPTGIRASYSTSGAGVNGDGKIGAAEADRHPAVHCRPAAVVLGPVLRSCIIQNCMIRGGP
jgi:hypothetical protein